MEMRLVAIVLALSATAAAQSPLRHKAQYPQQQRHKRHKLCYLQQQRHKQRHKTHVPSRAPMPMKGWQDIKTALRPENVVGQPNAVFLKRTTLAWKGRTRTSEHVPNSPTSFTSMNAVPCSKPCLLRRRYVVHVCTASWHIF
ncbi:hypothetical protein DPMN_112153 [Dreissena polymorpha]|uniref:Secreted protein n=1 Tax=Dreissena polymorpha TaxID=45954 RepID=A0A9D4QPN3_DREPO|nr:hypothetical protein DPMN_112153 [Dreissena polymorpha]